MGGKGGDPKIPAAKQIKCVRISKCNCSSAQTPHPLLTKLPENQLTKCKALFRYLRSIALHSLGIITMVSNVLIPAYKNTFLFSILFFWV